MSSEFDPKQWHTLSVEDSLDELGTTAEGLSSEEARQRLEDHGPNRLPAPRRHNVVLRFLRHFHNILIYVLLGSALITLALAHYADSMVILAVIVANALIGFIQEGRAEKAMEAIREMLAPTAAVLRAGRKQNVSGEELVPGDIVLLEAGDKVPADLRLLQVKGLQVQEAILTGESVPVEKDTVAVNADAALGDRSCLAYSGTLVTSGQGRGVVTASGSGTEIGRISGMLAEVETLSTPLVKQMDVFAKWLTALILILAVILLLFGTFVADYEFAELFIAVVGLSVAAIPEGLPAVLTITLAVGVRAMARRNAIVRRLPAIETLGSVSVICSDKTGTLTRNEMSVATVQTAEDFFNVDGDGYIPEGTITRGSEEVTATDYPVLEKLALAAALCNDAELYIREDVWRVHGDPMEGALLAFAGKAGVNLQPLGDQWPRTDVIPFDAKYRFMASLNHDHENRACIFVKGAPERILELCSLQAGPDGETVPLEADTWHGRAEEIAAQGQRVLAFAMKPVSVEHTVLEFDDVEDSLVLLGMTGLMDPPRPETVDAIAECRDAGIRVKMITGDHAATARAIGRQIGLEYTDKVLTGAELDVMDDDKLARTVLETDVFARTSPEHKLRLVMALQKHGMTVAMTGDGVNDAPALKRADAGIAMGMKGSEAAKEASELVLADDNFASIVAAVREGRTVYDNLKKVITWTLPTNAGEAMTVIVALLLGVALPITPIQILWINLVTAVTLGMALAFEPTEASTMHRSPRPREQPLLTVSLIWQIVLTSLLFLAGVFGIYTFATANGYSQELARTMALNTLVVMEIFYLFYIRNIYETSLTRKAVRGTPVVWLTVIIVTAAQFALTYFQPLQNVFETVAVPIADGLLVVGVGVLVFAVIEIEKQVRLRLRRAADTARVHAM